MRTAFQIAIPILLGGMTACTYQGDGNLTDSGIFTAHERYVLDLGPVDLGRPWRHEYTMANLPNEEFTFGLRIAGTQVEQSTLRAKVKLVLTNEKDEVVFDVLESLPNWVWSGSRSSSHRFLYLRGVEKGIPTGGGSVTLEQVGVRADGGWGTYVSARRTGRYRLVCETVTPDAKASKVTATLVAVGGGWK